MRRKSSSFSTKGVVRGSCVGRIRRRVARGRERSRVHARGLSLHEIREEGGQERDHDADRSGVQPSFGLLSMKLRTIASPGRR